MREQIEFLQRPPDEVREAMSGWLRHHGIDADRVPMLWFDRCEETRRIRYPETVVGVDPARPLESSTLVVMTQVRTVQLEAAPSPFPPELRRPGVRLNCVCVNPALAGVLTVPPTWPATPRLLGSLCGPG